VQTFTRLGEPFTTARTRWMFGFHRRGVRRCEWETAIPKNGFFPQMSHTDDMGIQGNRDPRADRRASTRALRPGDLVETLLQLVLWDRAHPGVDQRTRAVVEQGHRLTEHAERIPDPPRLVEDARIRDLELLLVVPGRAAGVEDVDPEELDVVAVPTVRRDEEGTLRCSLNRVVPASGDSPWRH